MAQRPSNVVFTNPAAAQSQANLVRLYDIDRLKADDINRSLATTAQTISRRGEARDILKSQQIAEDRRLATQSTEAEKARQARDKETDKLFASNEKIAGIQASATGGVADARAAKEAYDFAIQTISSDDPPTDSEFAALTQGLDADRVNRLKGLLTTSRRAVDAAAAVGETLAQNWQLRLKNLTPGKLPQQVIDEFGKSANKNLVLFDGTSGTFRSARRKARMDVAPITPPTAVEQLDTLRRRVPGGARGATPATPGIVPDAVGDALVTAGPDGLPSAAPFPLASSVVTGSDLPPVVEPQLGPMWQPPIVNNSPVIPGTRGGDLIRARQLMSPSAPPPPPVMAPVMPRAQAMDAALARSAMMAPPNNPNAMVGYEPGAYIPPSSWDLPTNIPFQQPAQPSIPPWAFQVPNQQPSFNIISVDDILRANPMPSMDYMPSDFAPVRRAAPYMGSDFVPARRLAPQF